MMERSNDVLTDYRNLWAFKAYDRAQLSWKLDSFATYAEFQIWESDMISGFARCRALRSVFSGYIEYMLASRRVDETVDGWWQNEKHAKGLKDGACNWEIFREFLHSRFVEKSVEMEKVVIPEEEVPLSGLNM